MIRSCSVFVLIVGLQLISSQGSSTDDDYDSDGGPFDANDPRQGPLPDPYQEVIPRPCWGPPPNVNPYECCPIPQVFSDEEMAACGIEKPDPAKPPPPPEKYADEEFEPGRGPRRRHGPNHGPPGGRRGKWCSHGKCLLKNKSLLTDAEAIDYDKLRTFLTDWGKANSDYEDAIKIAIGKCVIEGGPSIRHSKCEADKVFICMKSTTLWNCKLREDLEQCTILKEHMEECRPYYMKPPPSQQD